jgi:hypothetical protein
MLSDAAAASRLVTMANGLWIGQERRLIFVDTADGARLTAAATVKTEGAAPMDFGPYAVWDGVWIGTAWLETNRRANA